MSSAADSSTNGIAFGPFVLRARERLLLKQDTPVELGARALDMLIALASAPNEIVSKQDLMSRVWPDVLVEEGSLRFHMAGLRKALGDGLDGARYITTIAGRGYCFVAPISRADGLVGLEPFAALNFPHANLPNRLGRMVGRDEDVRRLSSHLMTSRIVSIVGSGGVGKTTVAIAVAHHLNADFGGAALFVDFGMLSDPRLVAPGVASMLGLAVGAGDVQVALMTYLRDKRVLLILDTCEHLIDEVATLASGIIDTAPDVYILATSRESLRIEGERVYRLETLACPPDDPDIPVEDILAFPAAQLFIERARASGANFDFNEHDTQIVAGICRRLDGVALAVELAARRVETYGLAQTATLLDQHLTLGWIGSRTAPPRQKTLQATLDWSFGLLSEEERKVLRRLAIFVGNFTLDAALEVASGDGLDETTVFNAMDSLVAKSMVTTQPTGAMVRYRLLDTTRAYAFQIPADESELANLAIRHATYYQRWLSQAAGEWVTLIKGSGRSQHFVGLNNVRAALEWCFGDNGDIGVGVHLAAAAAPVFQAMSLLVECHRWSDRALQALDDALRGGADEMCLQAGYGTSSMYLFGETDVALVALNRSVEIAEARNDAATQVGLLALLLMFQFRRADLKGCLSCAIRGREVAGTVDDPAAIALGHSMLGRVLHVTGDLAGARAELEACLHHWSRVQRSSIYLARELHHTSETSYARVLWLQGHPQQALDYAHQTIERVRNLDNPSIFVVVLAWATSVFLWAGDWESAEKYIGTAIRLAETNSISSFIAVGRARKAELAIRRGDAKGGVDELMTSLEQYRAVGFGPLATEFRLSLAEGFLALGRSTDAATLIEREIAGVNEKGNVSYMPELLRLKGVALLAVSPPLAGEAETWFVASIDLSRRQGTHAWELRAATDLAKLWKRQGRLNEALELLRPIVEQFEDGRDTPDLRAAEDLLKTLTWPPGTPAPSPNSA